MRTWLEFASDDGTFNIDAVAASIEVRPETRIVGKTRPYKGITFAELSSLVSQADDMHHNLGDSEATAIVVDGAPAVEARLIGIADFRSNNPILQSLQTSLDILQNSFASLNALVTSSSTRGTEFLECKALTERVEKLETNMSNANLVDSEASRDASSSRAGSRRSIKSGRGELAATGSSPVSALFQHLSS
ncbi:hypothetical protein R1flu_004917 [Riccia fluitans]|uniref:Uncharacterized protein n=1 Tax=Riccia fluitans TaxID=41844 RepID=A0ABD1YRN0_9MARC